MSKLWAASLAAIVACTTTEAHAAKYLTVDIAAKGSGTRLIGSRTGAFPTRVTPFETFYASLSYNLEGGFAPFESGTGLTVVGTITSPVVTGFFNPAGFNFRANYPFSQFLSYNLTGNACYANASPKAIATGSPSVDASCSAVSFTYSDGFSLTGFDFTGTLTGINFRIVEAAFVPDVTFAIPEPATWALMLAGFGMVGYSLRRRRARLAFA
ncbi:PEPxxWA-CTERM sorting domain-containing protein [Sphingomonas sp. CFBP 8760]|uniref:PEPxxWA-CTERM sorting domain-containing protein n=1 Tax=Sphingomonas sp. CFBP 8760 TaxID=2775282 RepID=UPI001783D0CE|nr:PEPxxWA-CTERM sorting domain-containing protein [Sphingomonas sp. CFBP 8760]MBD8547906.1 PEPxxWA-CTERM sorting domain-containing protein [Sphingomonas sp. CFBP 8760]